MKIMNIQQGSALITVLLFVVVMTGLLLSSTEMGLLTATMNNQWQHKMLAFEAAEMGLISAEAEVQHKIIVLPPAAAKIITNIKLIDEDGCHKKRFKIFSNATYRNIQVSLESIYDYLPEPSAKCIKEKINQRIFWHEG
jgi:hypothetical protein